MANKADQLIYRLPSGWVFLCGMQFLSGYCILHADPEVPSLNDLPPDMRQIFLTDMALVGDAILAVTGAERINYALMGNSDPVLHAHIVPRYAWEPEELRKGLPWSHPNAYDASTAFNPDRDRELMDALQQAILARQDK